MDATLFSTDPGAPVTSPIDKGLQDHFAKIWKDVDDAAAPPSAPKSEEPKAEPPKAEEPKDAPAATTELATAEPPKAPEVKAQEPPPKKGKKLTDVSGRKGVDAEFAKAGDHLEAPKSETPASGDPLDALQVHPNASEAHKSQFAQLRDSAKQFRSEAKQYQARLEGV